MKHRALRMSRRRSSGIWAPSGHLTTRAIVEELNAFLTPGRFTVVADVGDCMYACVDLRTDIFLGPGYYNSMGFAVPAAIAAELAWPKRRAVALVGDGGFQMTGMDLGTAGTRRPSWPRWAPNLPGFLGVKTSSPLGRGESNPGRGSPLSVPLVAGRRKDTLPA
jgi:thiamine pyrophosphate-dependent acetolactate synthase large subunit-like protein